VRARSRAALVLLAIASVGACGGGDDEGTDDTVADASDIVAGDTSSSTTTTTGPVGTITPGPFCASIASLQGLGTGGATAGGPEEVLAQNEAMLDLLDEATATVPDGAPADVEALFDDYRAIAVAIGGAGGDIDAAYATIQEQQPELAARLFNETAHLPAFEFFVNHCGIRFQQG
jgi:hypothetical protein